MLLATAEGLGNQDASCCVSTMILPTASASSSSSLKDLCKIDWVVKLGREGGEDWQKRAGCMEWPMAAFAAAPKLCNCCSML